MHILPREAIRRAYQHQLERGEEGMVPEPIEARAVELGPAVPIVTIDMLLGEMPRGLHRDVGIESGELLVNGLGLLLTAGRDPHIDGDLHRIPPVGSHRRERFLPDLSSTAEGTGKRYPSAAGHRAA